MQYKVVFLNNRLISAKWANIVTYALYGPVHHMAL